MPIKMTERTKNDEEIVDADAADEETVPTDEAADPSPSDASEESAAAADGSGWNGEGEAPDAGADDASQSAESQADAAPDDDEADDLRADYDRLNDRHLRLVAEFNNFRRRSEQERLTAWSRAQADLVEGLLDVLDDLQRVADLDLSNATVEAIMEGIDLVERKFVRKLEEAGIEVTEPTGEPFDPERMEAMMRVPAETDEQVDTVAQVFQKGYTLKGILVRPARVSVYTQG